MASDNSNRFQSRHAIRLSSDIESDGVNSAILEDGDIFSYVYSDVIDPNPARLNHSNSDSIDDEFEEVVGSLHRSLATNGRNLLVNSPSETYSPEEIGIRIHESRRLFGNLDEQETSKRLLPAAVSFVKNVERVVVDSKLVCVICKENVCLGSVVIRLPCGHLYHPLCIKPWLNARNTCPLCRYELPTHDKEKAVSVNELTSLEGNNGSGGGRWWWLVAVGIGLLVCLGGWIVLRSMGNIIRIQWSLL